MDAKPMEVDENKYEMKVDTPEQPKSEQNEATPASPAEKDEMKVEEAKKDALVLGIDFGTQKCVAAVSATGFIFPRIVQNNLANQVTPNVLSFREKRRLIGEEALAAVTRSPDATIQSVKRFLGSDLKEAQEELEYLPYQLEDQGEYVAIRVNTHDEPKTFRPEQATAMMLKQLRLYTELHYGHGVPLNGCVLAVPGCFTLKKRRAIVDAAAIAGLNVLDVIDDVTAVALAYGCRRKEQEKDKEPPKEGEAEKPEYVLFVDMGHSFFSAKVVAFSRNKLKVLSSVSDKTAGARAFDYNLVAHFAAELKAKHGVDPFKNFRTLAKLTQAAEKTKKVLSTIDETFFEAENVGDMDFRGKVSKAKLEELSRDLLAKVKGLVTQVVSDAGLTPEDLQAAEIVGGGTRIPSVQEALVQALNGKPLSKTLDSAGSVALGATVMASIACPDLAYEFAVEDGREGIAAIESVETGTPKTDIEKYSLMEEEMRQSEQVIIATQEKKNELEQYVYNKRDLCDESQYASFISSEEKQAVFRVLDDARAWVDDNQEADLAALTEKFDSLKKAVDEAAPRLHTRLVELENERLQALKEAEEFAKRSPTTNEDKKPRSKKQKIEAADKRKNQGNILFKEFDYEGAARRYAEGLGYLADLPDLTETESEQMRAIKLGLHLNLAASCMKINRHRQAQENCTEALKLDPKNVKALFRRAQAFEGQKNWEEAKNDLDAALKIEPTNAEVKKEHAKVLNQIQAQKEKEKKMYAKMFS